MLQQLKSFLRDQIGLAPAAVLIAVGLFAHLALNGLMRKSATSPWGLLAPLLFGMALEGYEIWIQYRGVGLVAPGNDPLLIILARHGLDIAKMLAGPLVLVAVGFVAAR